MSEEESITVSTDKTSYAYGDNYTVSGKINPVIPHEKVSIMVLGTNYLHPESFSVTPDSDGKYSYTLPLLVKAISSGNFTIVAQYVGAKNQTSFNYAGMPCNQQGIPVHVISAPIIRGPPAFYPRIIDSQGNAVIGPVKVGQQIQISYKLENGLNCNMPFVYIVQIQDHNGITVSLSWITGTLLAGQSIYPAQSWTPQHNDTYSAQIFTWQSLDNPSALVPPASVSFVVVPNANFTKSSQMASEIPSKIKVGSQTTVPNFPLEQFKSGIATMDVKCNLGLWLVTKAEDGFPACVRPDTAYVLIHSGWAKEVSQTSLYTMPTVSHEPCDTFYPQSNTGVAVLYMPTNSTGKICATYHNPDSPVQSNARVFAAKDVQQMASEISISAHPDIVPTGNSTIVYDIKTKSQAGLYGISFFCGSIPFAVGYDNQSRIILDDFPWLYKNDICLSQTNVFQITGLSGIHVKYVTEAHRG